MQNCSCVSVIFVIWTAFLQIQHSFSTKTQNRAPAKQHQKSPRAASQVTPSICPVVEFYATFVLGILLLTSILDTPIWDPDLGPRFGTPIWDPDLGPRFGTPIWDPDLGPRFGTPMSLAKLNKILVISMKLYWHPAMSLAKLNKILVIWIKLYWHPAMQVMYKIVLVSSKTSSDRLKLTYNTKQNKTENPSSPYPRALY
jgi:hypothetical protein